MALPDGERLYLKVAEDFLQSCGPGGFRAVQAKHRRAPITLRSPAVRAAIRSFMELQRNNPGAAIRLNVPTVSRIGKERWGRKALGPRGLQAWQDAAGHSDRAADELIGEPRSALIDGFEENAQENQAEDAAIIGFLKRGTPAELRRGPLERLIFTCGAQDESGLEASNRKAAAQLCRSLFPTPGTEEFAYDQLLIELIRTILHSPDRAVDRPKLLTTLARATTIPRSARSQAERFRGFMAPITPRRRDELEAVATGGVVARAELAISERFLSREIDPATARAEMALLIEARRTRAARVRTALHRDLWDTACPLSFVAYLDLLDGQVDGATANFEAGFGELEDLGLEQRLSYLLAAVDALRETGQTDAAARLVDRIEPKLRADVAYQAGIERLEAAVAPAGDVIGPWRTTLRLHAKLLLVNALNSADHGHLDAALRLADEGRRLQPLRAWRHPRRYGPAGGRVPRLSGRGDGRRPHRQRQLLGGGEDGPRRRPADPCSGPRVGSMMPAAAPQVLSVARPRPRLGRGARTSSGRPTRPRRSWSRQAAVAS